MCEMGEMGEMGEMRRERILLVQGGGPVSSEV